MADSGKNNVRGLIKLFEIQGMINEAFGATVSVNKLEDFKNASPSMFEESMSPSLFEKAKVEATPTDFMASTEHSWINNGPAAAILTSSTNPFLKGDSGFISPACQSNNHSASSEDSAENHDEREATSSMASNEDDDRTLAKSPGKISNFQTVQERRSIERNRSFTLFRNQERRGSGHQFLRERSNERHSLDFIKRKIHFNSFKTESR